MLIGLSLGAIFSKMASAMYLERFALCNFSQHEFHAQAHLLIAADTKTNKQTKTIKNHLSPTFTVATSKFPKYEIVRSPFEIIVFLLGRYFGVRAIYYALLSFGNRHIL